MKKTKSMDEERLQNRKLKKILLITFIICLLIVGGEAGIFFYQRYQTEQKNVYYDNYNMSIPDGEDTVAVGSSFFRYSKINSFTEGLEKGKMIKLDSDGKVIFEIQYDQKYKSTFTSVLRVEDGYIVTGSSEYNDYQNENSLRDGLLVKYSLDGKKVWEKTYTALANTRFNRAILVDDGIVVVGSSLYEAMEVGNHQTGGGIIVKYDFDGNEIWHNNHGGNKSGSFHGIVQVGTDFYVTGKDGADAGNLVKFDKDGKYVWHKNYTYTDNDGNQDLTYMNNMIYVVGSKKILEDETAEKRDTKNTDGVILAYDLKGNLKNEVKVGGSSFERLTGITSIDDTLYVVGSISSTDSDFDIQLKKTEDVISTGVLLKYDKDLKLLDHKVLGGKNNDSLLNVRFVNDKLYISGFSNSKDGTIATKENNGKDYFGKIIVADKNLNYTVIK